MNTDKENEAPPEQQEQQEVEPELFCDSAPATAATTKSGGAMRLGLGI